MNAKSKIDQLRAEINKHNHAYYVLNSSTLTDAEFDEMYRQLVDLETDNPDLIEPSSPTQRIGAESKSGFKKVAHSDQRMLSLDNMRSAADLIKYFGEVEVVLEPKIDGASLKLIYADGNLVQAITRGNGSEGDDVTANARAIKSIPLVLTESIDIVVTGEVYMTFSMFNALNSRLEAEEEELMANPRNAAAGAIKLKNPNNVASRRLSFVAYGTTTEFADVRTQVELTDILEHLGFRSVRLLPVNTMAEVTLSECVTIDDEASLVELVKMADIKRKYLDLPTDGLVFKLNDLAAQRELGEGTKYPNYACAYKFPPEVKETLLIGITIQVGRTGRITPVAELQPVLLGGTIVRRASLCNQAQINRLMITPGCTVLVEKSAEIIPAVVKVHEKIYFNPKNKQQGTLRQHGVLA